MRLLLSACLPLALVAACIDRTPILQHAFACHVDAECLAGWRCVDLRCTLGPASGASAGDAADTAEGTDVPLRADADTDAEETTCVPSCDGRLCGPDGCGGACGWCSPGRSCDTSGQCAPGPGAGYAGAERLVQVLGPPPSLGTQGRAAVAGPTVELEGVLFGEVEALRWTLSPASGSPASGVTGSGEIAPAPSWRSAPIGLGAGDNVLVVEAWAGGAVAARDVVVVTLDPTGSFEAPPVVAPGFLPVEQAQEVIVSVPRPTGAPWTIAELVAESDLGTTIEVWGTASDSGDLTRTGDLHPYDGVASWKGTRLCKAPGWGRLRARAAVSVDGVPTIASGPAVDVPCVEPVTPDDLRAAKMMATHGEARVSAGDDPDSIAEEVLELFAGAVVAAGRASQGGYGLWFQLAGGLLVATFAAPEGTRGSGGEPGGGATAASRSALVVSPFHATFGGSDEGPALLTLSEMISCPTWSATDGSLGSLDALRGWASHGLVSLSVHGEALFETLGEADKRVTYRWRHGGSQEVLATGQEPPTARGEGPPPTCSADGPACPAGTACFVTEAASEPGQPTGSCVDWLSADLRLGRVVVTNRGLAVTPEFFRAHAAAPSGRGLVHAGACRSIFGGALAAALLAGGARAVTGFDGYVDSGFAGERALELLPGALFEGHPVSTYYAATEDPAWPGTWWRLIGDPDLDIGQGEPLDLDFEDGLAGWQVEGNAYATSDFAGDPPPSGRSMAMLSTGLGADARTGRLRQTFCRPPGVSRLLLTWRLYSEEFEEWCGSRFNDPFSVIVSDGAGGVAGFTVTVQDLCQPGFCPEGTEPPAPCDLACLGQAGCSVDAASGFCEGTYPCGTGRFHVELEPVDVSFDQGGVFRTPWLPATIDLTPLGDAERLTVELSVGSDADDENDGIYDTAVLVDALVLE